jgi:hypothetical protein
MAATRKRLTTGTKIATLNRHENFLPGNQKNQRTFTTKTSPKNVDKMRHCIFLKSHQKKEKLDNLSCFEALCVIVEILKRIRGCICTNAQSNRRTQTQQSGDEAQEKMMQPCAVKLLLVDSRSIPFNLTSHNGPRYANGREGIPSVTFPPFGRV